ncbi:MAG: zinc-dependent alcohol dehydrogenase [Streptosporangiaceae bacterium]
MDPRTMQVARLHGVGDIRIDDEAVPEPGPGEQLVRVTAVGICGSDLHWWDQGGIGDAQLTRPLVLGHEGAGVIADGPRRGERVAIDPAIPCGVCHPCRDGYRNLCPRIRFAGHGGTDGAMREFLSWPAGLLHPLPEELSDADGAVLEPLGVALHSYDLGHLRLGGTAAVIGCGPIGLLLIQLLGAAGAQSVIAADPLPHRREAAAKSGADRVADPGQLAGPGRDDGPGNGSGVLNEPAGVRELAGDGVDVAFEVAGTSDAVRLAMDVTRPGGRVVLAGIPDDDLTTFRASVARRKGLTIAMVRRMNEVYPRAIGMAARGQVDLGPVVTHHFPLTDVAGAFGVAARRAGLKVIVEPGR